MAKHIGYDTSEGYMGKLSDGSWMLFASSTDYDDQIADHETTEVIQRDDVA